MSEWSATRTSQALHILSNTMPSPIGVSTQTDGLKDSTANPNARAHYADTKECDAPVSIKIDAQELYSRNVPVAALSPSGSDGSC